jgi:SagB-type dehydrogenase family enzyme
MRWLAVALLLTPLLVLGASPGKVAGASGARRVALPAPRLVGALSVEAALARRRSVRAYAPTPSSLAEISQLLWSAQGVTHAKGFRTAPSAGALYPLELYLVVGSAQGLEAGVYRYDPSQHVLHRGLAGDRRPELAAAALEQNWIADAPLVLVFGAVYARSEGKYRGRAVRYAHMEVGHAVQNVYLQAEALGLGTCIVGGFDDDRVRSAVGLPADAAPIGIMPVGRSR